MNQNMDRTNLLKPISRSRLLDLAKFLAEIPEHSELTELFLEMDVSIGDQSSGPRWSRAYEALLEDQKATGNSTSVAKFVQGILDPYRFLDDPARFRVLRHKENERVAFFGWSVSERGKLVIADRSETLTEATMAANRVIAEMRQRDTHPHVFKYCTQELLADDLFHALHEATKGVSDRIEQLSGRDGDGAPLFNECFSGEDPTIQIVNLNTRRGRKEQSAFLNLLIGTHGLWRNTTAHEARLNSSLKESEVIDAMTTLSYIHKRLDQRLTENVSE